MKEGQAKKGEETRKRHKRRMTVESKKGNNEKDKVHSRERESDWKDIFLFTAGTEVVYAAKGGSRNKGRMSVEGRKIRACKKGNKEKKKVHSRENGWKDTHVAKEFVNFL